VEKGKEGTQCRQIIKACGSKVIMWRKGDCRGLQGSAWMLVVAIGA